MYKLSGTSTFVIKTKALEIDIPVFSVQHVYVHGGWVGESGWRSASTSQDHITGLQHLLVHTLHQVEFVCVQVYAGTGVRCDLDLCLSLGWKHDLCLAVSGCQLMVQLYHSPQVSSNESLDHLLYSWLPGLAQTSSAFCYVFTFLFQAATHDLLMLTDIVQTIRQRHWNEMNPCYLFPGWNLRKPNQKSWNGSDGKLRIKLRLMRSLLIEI